VTGLQTRYHLSEATGERRFMVVRFTPLGAHLFLRLSMDALADRTVGLEQIDPGLTSLASDRRRLGATVRCGGTTDRQPRSRQRGAAGR